MERFSMVGMANVHSHAFQRDMRGLAERGNRPDDDFWSWRQAMFASAQRMDPEAMRSVGERLYSEMRSAGYGLVGEFHYVHHQPDGTPYEDPNILAKTLAEAAEAVGLAITLIPAAYNRGGYRRGLDPGQRRFSDPSVAAFLERVEDLREWADGRDQVSVGIAAHSIRAVPGEWLDAIAAHSERHSLVRHIHASEQPREIRESEDEYGRSPIEVLADHGFLGPRTTVVHGIHVSDRDIEILAESDSIVASCPTTEGNLGDGYFPALRYRDAGVRIAIGSDSNVIIDPFEEVRELETGSRREGLTRHGLLAANPDLWNRLALDGGSSLGLTPARIELDLEHPRLRGIADEDLGLAFATCATAAAVVTPGSPLHG